MRSDPGLDQTPGDGIRISGLDLIGFRSISLIINILDRMRSGWDSVLEDIYNISTGDEIGSPGLD